MPTATMYRNPGNITNVITAAVPMSPDIFSAQWYINPPELKPQKEDNVTSKRLECTDNLLIEKKREINAKNNLFLFTVRRSQQRRENMRGKIEHRLLRKSVNKTLT